MAADYAVYTMTTENATAVQKKAILAKFKALKRHITDVCNSLELATREDGTKFYRITFHADYIRFFNVIRICKRSKVITVNITAEVYKWSPSMKAGEETSITDINENEIKAMIVSVTSDRMVITAKLC